MAATGTAPLAYQWRKDGTVITGGTNPTLVFLSAQIADNASYDVVVSNIVASVASSAAALTVTAAPVGPAITTQPVAQSVFTGVATSFSVVASGTAPLTYQWRKNGTAIVGATDASLSFASSQLADGASYDVVITNVVASVTSSAAVLTVTTFVPPIIIPPADIAPIISSVTTAPGTVGVAFVTYAIVATGSPTSYNATGLPAGLSLNTGTGTIGGTPTSAGIAVVLLSATNSAGTGTSTLTITVTPAGVIPVITSPLTAVGTVGTPSVTYFIAATATPTSYGASNLPPGMALNRACPKLANLL